MHSQGLTHIGKIRKVNQDAFFQQDTFVGPLPNLYVLADGMGGHQGGEIASKLAVETVIQTISNTDEVDGQLKLIEYAIIQANERIFEEAAHENGLYGMGTTLIVMCADEKNIYIGHIGDSRLYVMDGHLRQVTKDHSYVQELVDAGAISEDEARIHPKRNRITRAVGVDHAIDIDLIHMTLDQESDSIRYILICSDGLTNGVEDMTIEKILGQEADLKEKCQQLIDKSLEAGGTDNITCIVIENK